MDARLMSRKSEGDFAGAVEDEKPRKSSEDDFAVVAEAKARWKRAQEWESAARALYAEDIKFAEADSDHADWQWPGDVQADRGSRPCLVMNKVRQHCLQIINDARQNKAQVKVTPVGEGATFEAAQMLSGLVRHIEYQSQATEAYEAATNTQVRGGIGYWRVETDYAGDDTLELEIFVRRVPDPMAVCLDPDIRQFDGSDAKWGIIHRDRPHDEAEDDHPDLKGMLSSKPFGDTGGWLTDDSVREAEYYRVVDGRDTLHRLDDGTTVKGAVPEGRRSVKSRSIATPRVEWFKIVGDRIVDREDWPGRYVPIVRVVGEETVIDGKLDRKGHTRAMKDAQRIYNYWCSSAVEFVALQSKTPFVAPVEAIEGFETYWENANTENRAVLPYNHRNDGGQEVPPPKRQEPPVMAQAYIQGMTLADTQLLQVSGQYQAELGRPGNETSGVAIQQRQRQGDNATYHYIDHLAQAIRFTGRILIDLIPHVYDTPRVLKILQEDGTEQDVHIDPSLPAAHGVVPDPSANAYGVSQTPQPMDPSGQQPSDADQAQQRVRTFLNPSVGRYFVQADVGPSYGTQRQEAFEAFTQITSQNKELMPVVGDILFRDADMPGADEVAERLKRMVPPQALGGPSPQVQQLQGQLQAVNQHAQQMAQHADATVAQLRSQVAVLQDQLKDRGGEVDNRTYDGETKRLAAIAQGDPDAFKVLIRTQLSQLLGMPALPVMQAHAAADAAHQQAIAPMPMQQDQQMPADQPPGGSN